MKAQLKEVKVWMPHKKVKNPLEEEFQVPGSMRVYVGSFEVGWVEPTTTEPEELFTLHTNKLLMMIDWNDTLIEHYVTVNGRKRKTGKPLQQILDSVELVFKDFLNKIVK